MIVQVWKLGSLYLSVARPLFIAYLSVLAWFSGLCILVKTSSITAPLTATDCFEKQESREVLKQVGNFINCQFIAIIWYLNYQIWTYLFCLCVYSWWWITYVKRYSSITVQASLGSWIFLHSPINHTLVNAFIVHRFERKGVLANWISHIWKSISPHTVYPKKYAHGFVVLCFVVVMQSFIMNSHKVFIHIYQGCFAGTGAIVRLPQCQWSKPDGYGKISQCITTTKHSKAKTVSIFLGIYCMHAQWNVGWNYLSIPKLLRCNRCCLGIDK